MELQSSNWAALGRLWQPLLSFQQLCVCSGFNQVLVGLLGPVRSVTSKPCLAEIPSPNWPVNRSGSVPEDREPKPFAFLDNVVMSWAGADLTSGSL